MSVEKFNKDGFYKINNLLSDDLCKIFTQYALFDMLGNFTIERSSDPQIPDTHSIYGDYFTESLLLHLKPTMEKITGMTLVPSYSYYRVYKPGDILKKHVDREPCEISVTVTAGFDYKEKSSNYNWGILFHKKNGQSETFYLNPGDGIIYKGCDIIHSRDIFDVPTGSYQVQFFLHYMNINNSDLHYFMYDRRPMIGTAKNLTLFSSLEESLKGVKKEYS